MQHQKRYNKNYYLGRRCRFPKYEPILKGTDWGKYVPAEDQERMLELTRNGSNVNR